MHLERGMRRHNIDQRWRCSDQECRKSISVFDCTLFERAHLSIGQILRIMYLYSLGLSFEVISTELIVSILPIRKLIDKCFSSLTNVSLREMFGPVGSADEVVEVDETHITSRRDARGRILRGERYWIIGAISRTKSK